MSFFEIVMLICFGLSWPISIVKSLRTKVVIGKSPLFLGIICVGYLSGIAHKLFHSPDWIISLYALNLLLVAADMVLYFRYAPKKRKLEEPSDSMRPAPATGSANQ
jgi:hypothetical protein